MSEQFLTIKEASEKYKKAEITIRRLVRQIVQDAQEEERKHIVPSPDEVNKLKKKSKPFTYKVSADLLDTKYKGASKSKKNSSATSADPADAEYLELLKKTNDSLQAQLAVKDQQISSLNQTLDDLSERQRETNILMKGFQEKFLLESSEGKKKRWWHFS